MSEKRKKILTNLNLGLLVAVTVFIVRRDNGFPLVHQLCDCCFVAGILLLGLGGLTVARNAGTFDMMAYGLSSALRMSLPWIVKEKKDADFVAYQERKREERKPATEMLIAGAVYMALALILLIIYSATK
jgi:hypothetical protein